jgi:hypothetical protein
MPKAKGRRPRRTKARRATPGWSKYQEEVAQFFRDLGLDAKTNETIKGARTTHDIDVVVRSKHAGLEVVWLVECKAWRSRVPKEKVLALRTIVDDAGADRGFVMAERGYQSGALEAARLANTTLTSLSDLRETLAYELGLSRLRTLAARLDACQRRYWNIGKYDRIDHDLRPEIGAIGYSGHVVITAVNYTLSRALMHGFPVSYDRVEAALSSHGSGLPDPAPGDPGAISSPIELFDILNEELGDLERRLGEAEAALGMKQ